MRVFGVRRVHFADTIAATVVSTVVAFLAVPVAVAAAAVVAVAVDSGFDEDAVDAATVFGSAASDGSRSRGQW